MLMFYGDVLYFANRGIALVSPALLSNAFHGQLISYKCSVVIFFLIIAVPDLDFGYQNITYRRKICRSFVLSFINVQSSTRL